MLRGSCVPASGRVIARDEEIQILMAAEDESTHFGYETVSKSEKPKRVDAVFDSVAERYDLMNDLMSFGIHRLWKRATLARSRIQAGQSVLDLAAGSGDLALPLARRVGAEGRVILADINAAMLTRGRERLTNAGFVGNIDYVQADAERLPFADNSVHEITIAFGLRNVTDPLRAMASMHRLLKPGGQLLILEFSHPHNPLMRRAYNAYSFTALPLMGRLVAGDADSYRYLAESIRMHPDQETLKSQLEEVGFERCRYWNLTGGVVALHRGYKF